MNRKNRSVGLILMLVGILLFIGAAALTVYNVYDSNRASEAADEVMSELLLAVGTKKDKDAETTSQLMNEVYIPDDKKEEAPEYVVYPEKSLPTVEIKGQRYIGYIEFPDLGLILPVAGEEWSYEALDKTPCLYSGSVYTDDAIIAGHNYTAHFGPLSRLSKGSEVIFTDVEGNVFRYELSWTETINENDSDAMHAGDDWDLTLFTCNYTGNRRYTLRCVRV